MDNNNNNNNNNNNHIPDFSWSQKGKRKLTLEGFAYTHNKAWTAGFGERHLWTCERKYAGSCKATVTTDDHDITTLLYCLYR